MKFALTGSSGLLGSAFLDNFKSSCIPYQIFDWRIFLEKSPLEISDIFKKCSITHFIHCAANTNIKACQADPENCIASNILVPKIISISCAQSDVFMCFISSTGIYDADINGSPSTELTPLKSLNSYHESKIKSEKYVQMLAKDFLIARVGWLFGHNLSTSKNFILDRLREAFENKSGVIYSDPYQLGNPTCVNDCATMIINLMTNRYKGIFNIVNQGSVTRLEYVQEIYKLAKINIIPTPIKQGRFTNSYRVSVNESAINQNLDLLNLDTMPDFRYSLSKAVYSILSEIN